MVKLLGTVLCLYSSLSIGQSKLEVENWSREVMSSSIVSIPNRFVLVESWKDEFRPVIPEGEYQELNKGGLASLLDGNEVDWVCNLNFDTPQNTTQSLKLKDRVALLARVMRANVIVLIGGKYWRLIGFENGRENINVGVKGAKSLDKDVIYDWFSDNLGYSGVVLSSKNDQVLIGKLFGTFDGTPQQALAISQSDARSVIFQNNRTLGLLSMEKSSGNFAIFKPIFLEEGAGNVPVGTKVQIEAVE